LEGRSIAYVFYLSTLNKSEGGSLGLYSSKNKKPIKIAKRIQPEFNSFIFFKVSDISFHEVEEITSKKSRVSINGWLHGK
jgi:Rps23 Pro-64 3,4-dihydroxylase Tpa1-like proline 4-hydroxylase